MSGSVPNRQAPTFSAGVSRLIPGVPAIYSEVPRRKSATAVLDIRYRAGWKPESAGPERQGFLRAILELAMPLHASGHRRLLVQAWLADLLLASVDAWLVIQANLQLSSSGTPHLHPSVNQQVSIALLFGCLTVLLCGSEDLYSDRIRSRWDEHLGICRAIVWASLLLTAVTRLVSLNHVSVITASECALLNAVVLVSLRLLKQRRAAKPNATGDSTRNVLIVGAGTTGRELATLLKRTPRFRRTVKGFIDQHGTPAEDVLGRIGDLARVARAHFVDEVIITISQERELARQAVLEAHRNHLDIKVVPDLFGCRMQESVIEQIGRLPLVAVHEEPIPAAGLFLKRALDLIFSAFFLLLASPVLGAIAIAVRLDSPGPALYRAERLGRKGRRFVCLKFRTMVNNADAMKDGLRVLNQREGPFFKIAEDPRITRVGHFLRRYSLDELPQLWNVLRGEMSLVGPRPHPLDDCQRYQLEHLRRLDVVPGITGLWQVTARRDPSFDKNLALDLEYIENWRLSLDLRILGKTLATLLGGTGA